MQCHDLSLRFVTGLKVDGLPYASADLSSGMCGGAALPILSSSLADHFGITAAFTIPGMVYSFIALFLPSDYPLRKTSTTH